MKDKKGSKGFTLIELIAVLVIMAIITLIVTPLVLNIIKKAKDSANKRSVDAYGKSIDLAVASYLLDTGNFPTSIDELTIEYSGTEVVCGVEQLNEDSSVYLSECSIGGVEVTDSSTDDGYYHYGKLNIQTYQAYSIGDLVTYNGIDFYVIENSDENTNYVTLLKSDPLSIDEVNAYGEDDTVKDVNGYGGIGYFTCSSGFSRVDGIWYCGEKEVNYDNSNIKYVIDNWSNSVLKQTHLEEIDGYKVRLIFRNELIANLGYANYDYDNIHPSSNGITPNWVYNENYGYYWIMDTITNINHWAVTSDGRLSYFAIQSQYTVRPVINLKKVAIY